MRFRRWNHQGYALAAALAAAALAGGSLPPAAAAKVPLPVVKLIPAQRSITVVSFRGKVFLDPGIWVAALGSPLQFNVQRASYTKPVTITQIIHPQSGGTVRRRLPASLLDGFNGLRRFITLTVRNSAGKVAATRTMTFCPNTFDPQRADPSSPATSPYPQQCGTDPFPLGMPLGIQRGWAVDPNQGFFRGAPSVKLPPGVYEVTGTINPVYIKVLHIPARDATARVKMTVVKAPRGGARRQPARAASLPSMPKVPTLAKPPASALPDLVPLPAWLIRVSHPRHQTHDFLDFGATVWIGGNGPLDVEGFRSNGSPVMKAYQYFWRDGRVIGRVRAGTMGFDGGKGHNHWHFQQFARYTLLNSSKKVAVSSHKVGFCIAPTDEVNLLLPRAMWQPTSTGLFGACGSPTALWVTEELPVGWGDTYVQTSAGQNFDITHVPNGIYYIEVTANPERLLYETTTGNDVSLRKIILGGTPGHRTVQVPPWHGLDPEP